MRFTKPPFGYGTSQQANCFGPFGLVCYSGPHCTGHLNSGSIWKPDFQVSRFWTLFFNIIIPKPDEMVRCSDPLNITTVNEHLNTGQIFRCHSNYPPLWTVCLFEYQTCLTWVPTVNTVTIPWMVVVFWDFLCDCLQIHGFLDHFVVDLELFSIDRLHEGPRLLHRLQLLVQDWLKDVG